MNKAYERWVSRLADDGLKQGHGLLTHVDLEAGEDPADLTINDILTRGEHCCLGVACADAVLHGIIPFQVNRDGTVRYGTGTDNSTTNLPGDVCRYLGIEQQAGDGSVLTASGIDVISMNDGNRDSFAEIAAALRAGTPQNAMSGS
jgi:hypothetical protein